MKIRTPYLQTLLVIASLAAILAGGLGVRSIGSDWPALHPDAHKLTRWIKRTSVHAYVTDQVYPNGFFVMFRPVQRLVVGRLDRPISPENAASNNADQDRKLLFLARAFNAWLGIASAFLAFLMARRIFDSNGAGLVAAWAVAFHPFFVEHCHYIETDAAMVFTLFLALFAWTMYLSNQRRWTIPVAALLSGFAVGTKFTSVLLLPLVFLPLLHGLNPKSDRRPWAWLLAGLAAFIVGFIAANIALVIDPEWFFTRLRADTAGTLAESKRVIGAAYGRPMALFMHQLRWLGKFLADWHAIPLLAGFAGVLAWFRIKPVKPFRAVAWFFPVMFIVYLLFRAPWIRMQETFNLLPAFALATAALFVVTMKNLRSTATFRRVLGCAGAILLILAGLTLLHSSIRRAQLFTWQDSRFAAGQWLARHMDPDRMLGLERYTKAMPMCATPVPLIVALDKIEDQFGPGERLSQTDYVLRNETFPDRGRFDPFTGKRYSNFEARRQLFLKIFQPLRSWSPCPPETESSFAFVNPELTLYGRIATPLPTQTVTMTLPRPIIITDSPFVFPPIGHNLGAARAVPLTRKGAKVAIGGPKDYAGPVYAIIFTEDEPANVHISGLGDSAFAHLGEWSAIAIELKRSLFRLRLDTYECIRARTVSGSRKEKGHTYLTLAFTSEEAFWLSLWLGSRMKTLDFMDQVGMNEDLVNKGTNTLLGVARMRATAHCLRRMTAEARAEIAVARQVPVESLAIDGMSGKTFEDFSRINNVFATNAFCLSPASNDVTYMCRTGMPALFPPGNWEVRLELRATLLTKALPDAAQAMLSITMPNGDVMWQGPALVSNDWQTIEFTWHSDSYAPFEIIMAAPASLMLDCRRSAISWPLQRQLENADKLLDELIEPRQAGGAVGDYLPN